MHDFTTLHTRHNASGQPVENHKPLSTSAARIRAARLRRLAGRLEAAAPDLAAELYEDASILEDLAA